MVNSIDTNRKIHWWEFLFLIGVILLACFFRWRGLNWDQNHHYHPDERYISWVATSVDFLGNESFADAFSPSKSTFNPFYWPAEAETGDIAVPSDEPRKFAYGHLPLYLGVLAYNFVDVVIQSSGDGEWGTNLFKHLLSWVNLIKLHSSAGG